MRTTAALFLAALVVSSPAQGTARVEGVVLDQLTGAPLNKATAQHTRHVPLRRVERHRESLTGPFPAGRPIGEAAQQPRAVEMAD